MPTEDPLTKPTIAASEKDLMDVYSYRKALRELQAKAAGRGQEDDGPTEDHAAAAASSGGPWRGKKQDGAAKEK